MPPKKKYRIADTTPFRIAPWQEFVQERFDSVIEEHCSLVSYLTHTVTPHLKVVVERIDAAVPKIDGLSYATEIPTSGICVMRLTHWGFHPDAGLRGHAGRDATRLALKMILDGGLETNVDIFPSRERLTIRPLVPEVIEGAYARMKVGDDPIERCSIGLCKGWLRTLVSWFIVVVLSEGTESSKLALENLQNNHPEVWKNFCAMHCHMRDDILEEQIWHHRKITCSAALTRTLPNVFNLIHQLRHLLSACQLTPETALSRHGASQMLQEYKIGKQEHDAAMNLMTKAQPEFVQVFREAVQQFGMHARSGVISHAVLASPKIAVGSVPDEKITSLSFRNEATLCNEGQILMAQRIVCDHTKAAPGMRCNLKIDGFHELHALTCAFMLCLKLHKAMPGISNDIFAEDFEILKAKFMKKYADHCLRDEMQKESKFDVAKIGMFASVLSKRAKASADSSLAEARMLQLRLLACNVETSVFHIKGDSDLCEKILAEEKANSLAIERTKAKYCEARYNKSLQKMKEYLAHHVHLVPCDSTENMRLYHDFKRAVSQKPEVAGAKSVLQLFVLDLLKYPEAEPLDDALEKICDTLHQDGNAACLICMTTPFKSGPKPETCIRRNRDVEDRLVSAKCSMAIRFSLSHKIIDKHSNDSRYMQSEYRLSVSLNHPDSPWLNGDIAKGEVHPIDVLKVTEMVRRPTRIDERERATEKESSIIAPQDRVAQRGPKACQQILTMTVAGIPNSPPCVVFSMLPTGVDDWSIAMWNQRDSGWFYFATFADKADHEEASKLLNKVVLEQWWENHPDAGSATPPDLPHHVPPPLLQICQWDAGSKRPVIPDVLLMKYEEETSVQEVWNEACEQFWLKWGKGKISSAPVAAAPEPAPIAHGPEWTSDHPAYTQPTDPVMLDQFCSLEASSTDHAGLWLTQTSIRDGCKLMIDKSLILYVANTTGADVTMSPCELLGFGTGAFTSVAALSTTVPGIPFWCDNDTALVVVVKTKKKKVLLTLADAIYDSYQSTGVPQAQLEGHVLVPKKDTAGNGLHFRYDVRRSSETHCFEPNVLDTTPETVQRAALGGVWKDNFDKVPQSDFTAAILGVHVG